MPAPLSPRPGPDLGPLRGHRLHYWIACGFGAGFSPWAPGTAGTLAGIPLYGVLLTLPPWTYLPSLALGFLVGLWACDRTARELGGGDPGAIVWDEILGLLVTLAWVPPSWTALLLGLVLFRLFDILKPWPIGALDRGLRGGWGIMMDDLAAGLLAGGLLKLSLDWFPSLTAAGLG